MKIVTPAALPSGYVINKPNNDRLGSNNFQNKEKVSLIWPFWLKKDYLRDSEYEISYEILNVHPTDCSDQKNLTDMWDFSCTTFYLTDKFPSV